MLKSVLAASAAFTALVAATPAAAQMGMVPGVPTAPSGPRIELQAGFEGDRADLAGLTYEADGSFFAVAVGYDIPVGPVALGIDFEAGQSGIENAVAYEDFDGFVTGTLENDSDLYLGGRVTLPVGPLFDIYAKAGYSQVGTIADLTIDDGVDLFNEFIEDKEDGLRVGFGARYYIIGGAYLGGEYRYSNYDESEITKHQAVATLGYHF
ncbi:outer membrane beta-barrel protein [Sphingomicrobium aestuariivivum]|uniref:outer membrane beta-barrel protein n=1 Tax=Sphingomicrobium aestuariivivum TaxID=1582356 RepID=UPI001FD6AC9A|nr:outer membrane beta-barrel protein [Sphingomicrobium aestuariivivum]MCJ8189738.1 porin family protein [Sphingomicrobium aestuariivivum]